MNQLYSLYWPTKTGCNQKPLRGWHGCNMNKLAIQPQIEVFLPIDPANTGISCYWPITWGTGIHLSYGTAYCMLLRWQVTLTQAVTTNNTIYNMIIYMSYSINFMWHCTPSLLTYTCYYFGIPIYILYSGTIDTQALMILSPSREAALWKIMVQTRNPSSIPNG